METHSRVHLLHMYKLHVRPRMADKTLHRDKRLVSYVRVFVRHQFHNARLPPEVREYPVRETPEGREEEGVVSAITLDVEGGWGY